MFEEYAANQINLFDPTLFINRLLKAYMKRSENGDYLRMLFGKILEKLIANDYAQTAENRKNFASTEAYQEEENQVDGSPERRQSLKANIVVNPSEEELKSDVKADQITPDQIIGVLDDITKKISKKLVFMPISIRYLCKLTEKIANATVVLNLKLL